MSYSDPHETSYLRTFAFARGTPDPRSWAALQRCFRTAPRCQILLASSRPESPPKIARTLGCASQTVRNAIHTFNERGAGSSRPKRTHAAFEKEEEDAEALKELLHRSPREFGKKTSIWTLEYAAQVSFEEGLTERRVSGETIRAALVRLGVRWERAKRWIISPDPQYARKKGLATG